MATTADIAALCRIDANAHRWAWRHVTAARARVCVGLAVLTAVGALLNVIGGDLMLAASVSVAAGVFIVVAAAVTKWDIRSGIRRTVRGSRRIIVLSDDETAFLTVARGMSRDRPHWVIGRHAAIRVGQGHGANLRELVWGPLIVQADLQTIAIASIVPVRLEQTLINELPGAHRTSWLPFAREVVREPVATSVPSILPPAAHP